MQRENSPLNRQRQLPEAAKGGPSIEEIHGLGQTPGDWDRTLACLGLEEACLCPDLPGLLAGKEASYENLYGAFSELCGSVAGGAELCGLSLGAVLALQYAVDHPQQVRSLLLIAPQFKMPRLLLALQNAVFRLMPGSAFRQTGFGKAEFLQLCRTMAPLDLSRSLDKVSCPVLILCGEKDRANRKSAVLLAGKLPNARFRTVSGAGHACNEEAPEELAGLIRQFWEGKI